MTTLQDLLDQQAALDKVINDARKRGRMDAIGEIRALMRQYDLTASDLSAKETGGKGGRKGSRVVAKYGNPSTGESWSGRGLRPRWLKSALAAGQKIEEFLLAK